MSTIRIVDGGREITLPIKSSEVIRGVVEISAEIERIVSGRVTFHLKGRSIIPEVTRCYRPHKGEQPTDKE
jgi:hypothetical protein